MLHLRHREEMISTNAADFASTEAINITLAKMFDSTRIECSWQNRPYLCYLKDLQQ